MRRSCRWPVAGVRRILRDVLAVDCPRHGRVLVTNRRIVSVTEDPAGLVVRYRCWCGDEGEFHTGRPRPR